MEAKYEYQVFDPERKKKVQGIEGLLDLMGAYVAKGIEELSDLVASTDLTTAIAELEQKYPRAAVYLKAQRWSWSAEQKQANLGKAAMDRILDGDDPAVVLEEMESAWAAFNVAQEG